MNFLKKLFGKSEPNENKTNDQQDLYKNATELYNTEPEDPSKAKYYSEHFEERNNEVNLKETEPEEKTAGRFSAELKKKIEESTLQFMTHDLYMHYYTDDIVEDASNPEWQNLALFFWKNNEAFEKKSLPPKFDGLEKKAFILNKLPESVTVSAGKVIPWFGMPGGGTKYFFSRNSKEIKIKELADDGSLSYVEIINLTDSNADVLSNHDNYFFIIDNETIRFENGRFYNNGRLIAFADAVEMDGILLIREIKNIPEAESEAVKEESLLAYIWEKFSEGKFDEVINEADSVIENHDASTKNETLKLKGLSYFRQGKYNLSEEVFTELSNQSTSPSDWFNLITSAALNKNFELSEKALKKTIEYYSEYGTKEDLPIPQVFYYYMLALRDVKEYQKAFTQLEKLKDIYCKLVITDATFLYIRGVPFFEDTISNGKEILEHIDKDAAQKFLAELHGRLDDEGKDYIDKFEQTIKYKK